MKRHRAPQAKISDNDRFGMTFFLASIVHGIIILGITFSIAPPADSQASPALDIILLQTQSPGEVENADYLAQISQQGGGNAGEKARPRTLFSAATLSSQPGIAKQSDAQQSHSQQYNEQLALLTQDNARDIINTQQQLAKSEDNHSINEFNTNKSQAAPLAAEISHTIELQASTDKTLYLNSSTKAFTPAKYMHKWINRVERIGNLNYPDQARREKLSGTLILDVVIRADGKLLKIDLRQSSGHQLLDDAAKRIVQLAAPFSAFPEKLHQQAEVIHITRSWEFSNNSRIHTH